MFARFRNLFSKNKAESESEVESSEVGTSSIITSAQNEVNDSNEEVSKLEGLNLLKSLVETEQKMSNLTSNVGPTKDSEISDHVIPSLSQEVTEMLKNKLANYNDNMAQSDKANGFREEELMTSSNTSDNENLVVNGVSAKENGELNGTIASENSLINSKDSFESTVIHNKNAEFSDIANTFGNLNSPAKSIEISKNILNGNENPLENANKTHNVSKITSEILNNKENSLEIESSEISSNSEENTNISVKNVNKIENSNENRINISESEILINDTEAISVDPGISENLTVIETSEISSNDEENTNISDKNDSEIENSNENSSDQISDESAYNKINNIFESDKTTKEIDNETNETSENSNIESETEEVYKDNENETDFDSPNENSSCPNESQQPSDTPLNDELEHDNNVNDIVKEILQDIITEVANQPPQHIQSQFETNFKNSHENSPELSESSQTSSMQSIKENNASSTSQYPTSDSETNIYTNSSIVVEDLPSEVNTPSPTVDSQISVSSNTSTLDSSILNESAADPTKIIVNPINSNILACNAITSKLSDIAEVAESLDTVIRNIQENSQSVVEVEVESNPSPTDKKLSTLRSTSSEDWHSRSTEDDSFATASEGNFTPHSHSSSSFQTASGRTSSYISCDKSSFDASEADDSTFAFEMPELTSPLNMSFEESEQSYRSAQQLDSDVTAEDHEQTPTKLSESGGSQTLNPLEEDQNSIADIEDIHSESVTPTPHDHHDYHVDSIPIESETELEVSGISDAPSMEILTETTAMPMSQTPEVSSSNASAACSQPPPVLNSDGPPPSNEQNTNKPNAAWRRSKYYENITKQTIKGFL